MKATIVERGNGFPGVGSYVPGDDGKLYEVISLDSRVNIGVRPGASNWMLATVELADWNDCEPGDEYPAQCITPKEEQIE
jgi:hypothetical protein